MSWDTYGDKRRVPYLKIAAVIAIAILVFATIAVALVSGNSKQPEQAQESVGSQLSNKFPSPADKAAANKPKDNNLAEEDLTEEEFARYTDNATSPADLQRLYPQSASGLDAATFDRVRKAAEAVVTAEATLQGRQNYPGFFGSYSPTTAPTRAFTIDFSTAATLSDQPGLLRALVVWHGETWSGAPIVQMRRAIYFSNAGGSLNPVRPDRLPQNVINRDTYIDGVRLLDSNGGH